MRHRRDPSRYTVRFNYSSSSLSHRLPSFCAAGQQRPERLVRNFLPATRALRSSARAPAAAPPRRSSTHPSPGSCTGVCCRRSARTRRGSPRPASVEFNTHLVEAAFQRTLDDALPLGRKFWRRAGAGAIGKLVPNGELPNAKLYRCYVLYTPDSSLADAIDRGEIVVASKWGAEPDWN